MNILLLGETWFVEAQQEMIKQAGHRVVAIGTSIAQSAEFLKTTGYDAVLVGFNIDDTLALLEGFKPKEGVRVWVSVDNVTLPVWKSLASIGCIPVVRGTEKDYLLHYRPKNADKKNPHYFNDKDQYGSELDPAIKEIEAKTAKVGVLKQRVFSVYSSKGGVGKTTVALHLAAMMAEHAGLRTCVIDIDNTREGSDVARKNGYFLVSGETPNSVITNWANFPEREYRSWHTVSDYVSTTEIENLYFLSAPWNIEDEKFLTPELMEKVISILKQHMDIIIIDMSDNLEKANLKALELSDTILFVTGACIDSIDIASGFMQRTLQKIGMPIEKIRLVFNQVPSKMPYTLEEASQKIGLPLFHALPEQQELRFTRTTKSALADDLLPTPFGQSVYRLMQNLLPQGSTPSIKKQIPWYRRLFARKGGA